MQRTSAPNIGEAPLPQRARSYWKSRFSAFHGKLERLLEAERAQLPPWFVVGLASGIGGWFVLDGPNQWVALLCLGAGLSIAGFGLGTGRSGRALAWFALAMTIGCGLAWLRSEQVAAPRLSRPQVVSFDAKVEQVEMLVAKESVRLTLAPSSPGLPPRVRVSIDSDGTPPAISAGSLVRLRVRLAPPPPMALPGTYDFARDAWFKRIGAVGKALGPVEVLKATPASGLDSIRQRLGQHIRRQMPGDGSGIAVALVTGDQYGVSEDDADAMRASGLTHLLSVSGLHIAAVVAAAMFLSLKLLALSERLALCFNLVLASAGVAAAAGIGYTLLTGAQVPTVRSCVAALLVLLGIALGREAISIRLVAVGALVVLIFRPEALAGASFQMSFAAVIAIIAIHSTAWARQLFERREEGLGRRAARSLAGIVVTGLAVEFALIPFALFHFHRAGIYGVAANVIAIPLTTFIIMPAEAGALLLDSIGLGAPFWWLTSLAIGALLKLAYAVAAAPGAVAMMPSMPRYAFGLMVAGGLWLSLWNTRVRILGLIPIGIGAAAGAFAPTPDILVTGDGMHLVVVSRDGRPLLLRDGAGDFVRQLFSEASGFDGEPQNLGSTAFSSCSRDACTALISREAGAWRLLATRTSAKIDWATLTSACAEADIVVSDRRLPRGCNPSWLKLDRIALAKTGGLTIYLGDHPRVESVADRVGRHPWAQLAP